MAIMENVVRVGKTYKVRKRIPPECRAAFGINGEFVTVSLQTGDKREAREKAVPILAEIEAKIAQARGAKAPLPTSSKTVAVSRAAAFDALACWRRASIQRAHDLAWSGMLKPLGLSDEASRLSRLRYALGTPRDGDPDGFDERFAGALSSQGIDVGPDHPVLRRQELRATFRQAWLDVERFTDDFRNDRFSGWPEEAEEQVEPFAAQAGAEKATGHKLLQLFDLWGQTKQTPSRQRGYVRRLAEFLGDPDIGDITALDMDRFLVALKRFPKTKRPSDDLVPFLELIARYERADPDYDRLHIKTVWNWIVVYKSMFEFAVDRDLLPKNSAAKTMKKPSAEESDDKLPYEADDIRTIFRAPMFTGFAGKAQAGYRDAPGDQIVRDHKYWLPIVALLTAMRVEEIATLARAEIKELDGLRYIDLTQRPITANSWRRVKNAASRRVIPVPQRLIDLGFLEYVDGLRGEWVFPDLHRPRTDSTKWSSNFTGWWGLWCQANAPTKGQGFDHPDKSFHSFRHTWKAAAQESSVKEEIHDRITGHKGGNSVARKYGAGASLTSDRLKLLKSNIDQIEFPTLPLPG